MAGATPHQWIDTQDQLDRWLEPIRQPAMLAVDTEFMRQNTFHPRLALLQIRADHGTALVDPLPLTPGGSLRALLANPANTCIMHSASEDIEALADWLPQGPGQLFDTQIAAAMAGYGAGLGYQKLVQQLTGAELDKGETRSDWLKRPLTASQRDYATLDVAHLHELHAQLHAKLADQGRIEWLRQDCDRLCQRADHDAIDSQPQRKLTAAAEWPAPQQALLRRLLLWRERTARQLDQPRPWFFNDRQLLSLVAHQPSSLEDLRQRLRGQRAMRTRPCRGLFETLQQPLKQEEIEQTRAIPTPLDRPQRGVVKSMKQAVAEIAEQLDLPAGLLCPRRLLEQWLQDGHCPEEVEGWRRPLLEPMLQPLLSG